MFGARQDLAERFVALLADSGVSHGLIGPREVPRLWQRHVLNCAVFHPAIKPGSTVIDVGSGAGLPGLVLAIVRPDLHLHLVEPMLRRTAWIEAAVQTLGLDNVTVRRGRAQEFWGSLRAPVVTARAVAPIGVLAGWCLPLLTDGGQLLAIKGSSAWEELARDAGVLRRLGVVDAEVQRWGAGVVEPETTVLRLTVGASGPRRTRGGGRRPSARYRRDAGRS